jgi:hypothetical protein
MQISTHETFQGTGKPELVKAHAYQFQAGKPDSSSWSSIVDFSPNLLNH